MCEGGELIIIYLFNLDVNKNIRNLAKKKEKHTNISYSN